MKVAILFDGASALGASPDMIILDTVEAVEAALAGVGYEAVRVPVNPDARWIERLRRARVDIAFNLCEGIDGVATAEPAVVGVLELLRIPYTGSASWTTAVCLRKHVVNDLLRGAGLPVPEFAVVRRGHPLRVDVPFPAICKPAAEDASIGVEQRSVVRSARALSARLRAMQERWDEIVVQRFIDGREVNVGIVGDTVLPIAEIDFGAMPGNLWRIVTYRSKWDVGSDEDLGAAPRCPAELPETLAAEIRRVTRVAWRAVGGAGYGRCDFRIDAEGRPWLLEVNANPDIAPDAGLARMARQVGMDYPALVLRLCDLALERARDGVDEAERWALAQRLSGVAAPPPPLVAAGRS
jgi:D-alanine-D-alanine ligase